MASHRIVKLNIDKLWMQTEEALDEFASEIFSLPSLQLRLVHQDAANLEIKIDAWHRYLRAGVTFKQVSVACNMNVGHVRRSLESGTGSDKLRIEAARLSGLPWHLAVPDLTQSLWLLSGIPRVVQILRHAERCRNLAEDKTLRSHEDPPHMADVALLNQIFESDRKREAWMIRMIPYSDDITKAVHNVEICDLHISMHAKAIESLQGHVRATDALKSIDPTQGTAELLCRFTELWNRHQLDFLVVHRGILEAELCTAWELENPILDESDEDDDDPCDRDDDAA